MHSRIFGITTDKDEAKELQMSEDEFERYESFADYVRVVDEKELADDVEWLKSFFTKKYDNLVEFDPNNGSMTFKRGFKAIAEEKMLADLQKALEKTDYRDFQEKRWALIEVLNDNFGWHFEWDGWGLYTLEDFIVSLHEEQPYYIYGALDYHY